MVSREQNQIVSTYKRVTEVDDTECVYASKRCDSCPHKFPCKVHKAYRYWDGSPVCLKVKRSEG